MENKLISNSAYGTRLRELIMDETIDFEYYYELRDTYDGFLLDVLNISMFIPAIEVGDEWEVLSEPKDYKRFLESTIEPYTVLNTNGLLCEQYQTAKDKVIFEGFDIIFETHLSNSNSEINIKNLKDNTIEYLIEFDIYLTPYGMELSGYNK
jgi:hypothetical protein